VAKRSRQLLNPFHVLAGLAIPFFLALCVAAYLLHAVTLLLVFAIVFLIVMMCAALFETSSPAAAAAAIFYVIPGFVLAWSAGFLREFLFPLKDSRGG
jgi:hypothetical protein